MDYNHLFVCLMGMGTVFFGLICLVALSTLMSAVLRSVGKQPAVSAGADSTGHGRHHAGADRRHLRRCC